MASAVPAGTRGIRPAAQAPIDVAAIALGAVLLGHALQISSGFYSPAALAWLTLALATVISGVLALPSRLTRRPGSEQVVCGVLAGHRIKPEPLRSIRFSIKSQR
jgi:hypothetical protein